MTAAALERAETLRMLGRLHDAERTLREALSTAPDDPGLLSELAWVLDLADRQAEGLVAAEAAIALDAQEARHHQIRASLLSGLNRARRGRAGRVHGATDASLPEPGRSGST